MANDSTSFQYEPLRQEAQEIRVLRIQPRSIDTDNENDIECLLETVSLTEKPEYAALSYVWGDQSVKTPISVNGKIIHITENLNDALLRLRDSSSDLSIWADAICINQQDDIEKSWQVGLMLQIYREAARVIVWLGPSADDSDFIIEGFQDFGQDALMTGLRSLDGKELLDAARMVRKAVSPFNQFKNPVGQPGTFEEMLFKRFYGENGCDFERIFPPPAIEAFLRRAWWKRIWVLQEFSVARSVSFMCGGQVILAEVLESALILVQLYNDGMTQVDSSLFALERVCEGTIVGFENYVDETKSTWAQTAETEAPLQASDPRDIVFALLGLSADRDILGIKPNYAKTVRQVYEEVAIALVKENWQILLLILDVNLEAVRRKEWASWVPDWRRVFSARRHRRLSGIHHNDVTRFCAGAGVGKAKVEVYVENVPPLMTSICSLLDMVAEVKILPLSEVESRSHGPIFPLHDVSPAFIRSIQEAESFAKDKTHPLGYSVSDEDVVWRTLVADRIIVDLPKRRVGVRPHGTTRIEFRKIYQAIIERRIQEYLLDEQFSMIQQTMEDHKQGKVPVGLENPVSLKLERPATLSMFALTVRTMMAGRALLKTKLGLLCLGPMETKPGHLIVVPHQTPTPVALYPIGPQHGGEIWGASIGDMYVYGIMDGEIKNLGLSQRVVNFR